RLLGLLGLLAALIGVVVAHVKGMLLSWGGAQDIFLAALRDESTDESVRFTALGFAAGAGVALAVLLIEVLAGSRKAAFRRSAGGFNAAVQVLLALALLTGLNAFSFTHFRQIDCTRDRQFTLDESVQDQL